MNNHINISQIESWLHGKIAGATGTNVYAGSLPATLGPDDADMALIDVVDVKDMSEYGRERGEALVNVFVYVRPNSDGRKNVARMSRMEDAVAALIENDRDPHYSITEAYSDQGYDKGIGYHYKVTAIKIIIF